MFISIEEEKNLIKFNVYSLKKRKKKLSANLKQQFLGYYEEQVSNVKEKIILAEKRICW